MGIKMNYIVKEKLIDKKSRKISLSLNKMTGENGGVIHAKSVVNRLRLGWLCGKFNRLILG